MLTLFFSRGRPTKVLAQVPIVEISATIAPEDQVQQRKRGRPKKVQCQDVAKF